MNTVSIIAFVGLLKDVIIAIAAIVTAGVAVYGVNRWRRELEGKTQFDIARNLMKSTYKLRNGILNVRSRFIQASEFPQQYLNALPNPSASLRADAYTHVFHDRWQPLAERIQEFDTAALEAEAMWGADIRTRAEALRACLITLRVSIDMFIDYEYSDHQSLSQEDALKMREDVFASEISNDTLSNRIREAISGIEEKLRPNLKRC